MGARERSLKLKIPAENYHRLEKMAQETGQYADSLAELMIVTLTTREQPRPAAVVRRVLPEIFLSKRQIANQTRKLRKSGFPDADIARLLRCDPDQIPPRPAEGARPTGRPSQCEAPSGAAAPREDTT